MFFICPFLVDYILVKNVSTVFTFANPAYRRKVYLIAQSSSILSSIIHCSCSNNSRPSYSLINRPKHFTHPLFDYNNVNIAN